MTFIYMLAELESERPRLSDVSTCDSVPVIHLGDHGRAHVVDRIGHACTSYGFFQVINHGVREETVEKMVEVSRTFFDLPVEEKLKLYSDDPSKTMRLSTSFNVRKEKVHNWRDYLRLHCYPLDRYVPEWPSNSPSFRIYEMVPAGIIKYLSSSPQLINSSIQLTLLSTNPNSRVGIYYDDLSVYAAYHGQQITAYSSLPPFYQDHREANLSTASLAGSSLAVASLFGYEVARDQTAGRLTVNVKANGQIRWKVGTWVSGRCQLSVNCVVVIELGPTVPSGPVSSPQGIQCSTIV